MEKNNSAKLGALSLSLKTLATCLILTLLIGYGVSLVQVYSKSHFNLEQTVIYYRGDGDPESIHLSQSFATMLSVAHVHSFSQPLIFGALGLIFACANLSERRKAFLIALGFLGSVLSNLAPWGIKHLTAFAVYLLPLSQIMIATSLITMATISLVQLWRR